MYEHERKVLLAQIKRARDLPSEFLECRLLGHAWREVQPDRQTAVGEQHTYQCLRCLNIRDDVIAPKMGELLTRGYRHVPGYLMEAPEDGSRVLSAAALRAERARRLREGAIQLAEITPLPAPPEQA